MHQEIFLFIQKLKILSGSYFFIEKSIGKEGGFIHHSLEAGMKLHQERRFGRQGQHSLLDHRALYVVVLDDDVLLQDLDGVQFVRTLKKSNQEKIKHFMNLSCPRDLGSLYRQSWGINSGPPSVHHSFLSHLGV